MATLLFLKSGLDCPDDVAEIVIICKTHTVRFDHPLYGTRMFPYSTTADLPILFKRAYPKEDVNVLLKILHHFTIPDLTEVITQKISNFSCPHSKCFWYATV